MVRGANKNEMRSFNCNREIYAWRKSVSFRVEWQQSQYERHISAEYRRRPTDQYDDTALGFPYRNALLKLP